MDEHCQASDHSIIWMNRAHTPSMFTSQVLFIWHVCVLVLPLSFSALVLPLSFSALVLPLSFSALVLPLSSSPFSPIKRIQYHQQALNRNNDVSYRFGYYANNPSNPLSRHEVSRAPGHVAGSYAYVDANNLLQIVQYEAHPVNGFRIVKQWTQKRDGTPLANSTNQNSSQLDPKQSAASAPQKIVTAVPLEIENQAQEPGAEEETEDWIEYADD